MTSEAAVQNAIRIEAAKHGMILWRNNSGVLIDETGRPVRFGLGNDSKAVNASCKSSDLIGLAADGYYRGLTITGLFGRFLAIEAKREGWVFSNTAREKAQLAYINLVRRRGGVALFATSWEDVERELAGEIDARLETHRATGRGARGGTSQGVGSPHLQSRSRASRLQPAAGQALLRQSG